MVDSVIKLVKITLRVLEAVWYYARSIAKKLFVDDILFLASGLAFNCILTMVPLLLLSASAFGIFLESSQLGVQQLNDVLNAIFPPQPFATSIKESILMMITEIVAYRTSLGIFGVLVLLWTATSLFDALRSVLHTVFRIKRTRGVLAGFVHDLGFVFLVFVLFVASNLSIWVFTLVERVASSISPLTSFSFSELNAVVPTLIVIVITALMFYIVYRYIPDSRTPRSTGIIATITSTLLWVISGKIFSIYLSQFSIIGKVYGPYAFILVLLIWIYYSCIVFVIGAMVGQVYWERAQLIAAGRLERWV